MSNLLPQKAGQAKQMTLAGFDFSEEERGHWYSPAAVAEMIATEREACAGMVKVQKLCGGGTSWFYALCSCGYTLGASHQDNRDGMEKLRNLKAPNV